MRRSFVWALSLLLLLGITPAAFALNVDLDWPEGPMQPSVKTSQGVVLARDIIAALPALYSDEDKKHEHALPSKMTTLIMHELPDRPGFLLVATKRVSDNKESEDDVWVLESFLLRVEKDKPLRILDKKEINRDFARGDTKGEGRIISLDLNPYAMNDHECAYGVVYEIVSCGNNCVVSGGGDWMTTVLYRVADDHLSAIYELENEHEIFNGMEREGDVKNGIPEGASSKSILKVLPQPGFYKWKVTTRTVSNYYAEDKPETTEKSTEILS